MHHSYFAYSTNNCFHWPCHNRKKQFTLIKLFHQLPQLQSQHYTDVTMNKQITHPVGGLTTSSDNELNLMWKQEDCNETASFQFIVEIMLHTDFCKDTKN